MILITRYDPTLPANKTVVEHLLKAIAEGVQDLMMWLILFSDQLGLQSCEL